MQVEGFNTEKLNGVYTLVETKELEFNESQSIFEKQDLRLLLWYDMHKQMNGGRISSVYPLVVYSFYDMKLGWSENSVYSKQIKLTPNV